MTKVRNGIYQRGNSFQVRIQRHGVRISEYFRTRKEAEQFARAFRERSAVNLSELGPRAARLAQPPQIKSIRGLFDFVDKKRWLGNPNSKQPEDGPRGNALRFIDWVGGRAKVRDALSEHTIAAFMEERQRLYGNTGSTLNRYRSALSCMVTEALKLGLLLKRPEITKRREGRPRERIYTEQEEALILQTTRAWGFHDHAALFTFLVDTGCRAGETQKLLWGDFISNKIHLEGEITKNSTRRTITATPRALEAVKAMRKKYANIYGGPFSWALRDLSATRRLWNMLRDEFEWMGPECRIHTFRHTCASRLVQRGIDLYRVQIWLGHTTPEMTQRYAKFAPDQLGELAAVLARPASSFD